jgi:cytoskeletal protein CcmA (bactofilin family)
MALWNQTTSEEGTEQPSVAPPAPTPQATAIPVMRESASKHPRESVFGPGVTIEGKIEGDSDVRIGGKFKGDIQIKGDLNIEKGASLTAKVNAANVTLGGELNGNVAASGQVKLLETGQLTGDLKANTLTVAAGSRMRGHVEFGWNTAEAAKFVNGQVRENDKIEPADKHRSRSAAANEAEQRKPDAKTPPMS